MIVSLNWLKKFTTIDLPIDELATLIGARLVEIESVESIGEKYRDVVIVKVVNCVDHGDSDHLHVTHIDDGGVTKNVERDANGLIQVVCGAPNVTAGMTAAWLPPETLVPESFGTAEPFTLTIRDIRGVKSNGMLASARELALFEDHEGILEVDDSLIAGTSFVEALELDDYILDIENKSLTHRPDTFGIVGFAREVAAIQGHAFETPAWLQNVEPTIPTGDSVETPSVTIDNPALSARYQAIVLSGAKKDAKSPVELQTYLSRSGVRPISAIVDVTNYLMLETGQPLHAFDYDKVKKLSPDDVAIHVRNAKKGETLALLDGRTIELDTEDIVIAAGDTAVALAGAMGGADTEIDESTTNIIIESATFNLYNLRSTQMRHGIFSEAVTRFTKGQPPELTAPVLAEAVRLIGENAGAIPVSAVGEDYPGKRDLPKLSITADQINAVLGTSYTADQISKTLRDVEFVVEAKNGTLEVTAPYWRQDIHINEDIIEEVGRINGFDAISAVLPMRSSTAVRPDSFDVLRSNLRELLTRAGANEVLTYNFIHGDIMRKAGQNPDEAYRLTNSISPELQYYRQSITPSLLTNIHPNVKAGYGHFAIFELNKFHTKKAGLTDENVPKEMDSLGFVVTRSKAKQPAMYYEAKRYVDYLAKELGLDLVYEPLEDGAEYPVTAPFEPKRSARIWDRETRERVGVVGEFRRSVSKAFKLPDNTAGFEIATKALLKLTSGHLPYNPSSKFPSVERDICFRVDQDVIYDQVFETIKESLATSNLETTVEPIDIYQAEGETSRNITFRIRLASFEKTLTGEDASQVIDTIAKTVNERWHTSVV